MLLFNLKLNKIGLFYCSTSGSTETTARKIIKFLGKDYVEIYDVSSARHEDFLKFNRLILGIPTWGIGEMQEDWKDFILEMPAVDLNNKKIALFGLGDQESYPDTFADALGKLYDGMISMNGQVVGAWSVEGYNFFESFACRNNQFVGLVLDEDNQADLSDLRIQTWLKMIIPEMR